MSPTHTSSPSLPVEIKSDILRYCDLRSLAVSSRVSLAFLELIGPLLYEDIAIAGAHQLEKMIRSKTVLPSSIAPFVSLAQTRTFTYTLLCHENHSSHDTSLLPLKSRPIFVEELVVDFCIVDLYEVENAYFDDGLVVRLDKLLSSFDPRHLHILALGDYSRVSRFFSPPDMCAWPNLRLLTRSHSLNIPRDDLLPTLAHRDPLLNLELDLSGEAGWDMETEEDLETKEELKQFVNELKEMADDGKRGPGFGHVQVWLNDEEEVAVAERKIRKKVRRYCTSIEFGVKQTSST